MKKPDSLRKAITDRNPDLKKNPEKLAVLIRSGAVSARYSPEVGGYMYRFPLTVYVRDFAGAVDNIVMPIMLWVREYQPDLLLNHESADQVLNLSVDFLDSAAIDLDLTLNLTESVLVSAKAGGAFDVKPLRETIVADTERFPNVPPQSALDFLASFDATPEADNV